jgi:hypothetical protein
MKSKQSERERQRRKQEASRKLEQGIAISRPKNLRRRRRCLKDPVAFMSTYFGWIFWQPFTKSRRTMVESIIHAARYSGDYAVAEKRGGGKSKIALFTTFWLDLRGELSLPIIIGKNQRGAENELNNLKQAITESPSFSDDFPEVCEPLIALEGWASTARKQKLNGYRTNIGWEKDCLFLPTVPQEALPKGRKGWPKNEPSAARGQGIAVVGIDGKIRGFDRRNIRPDLALIDDIDDRESARSDAQTIDNRVAIEQDIAGLAGSGKRISRVMLCTTINDRCIAAEYTAKASWRGQRLRAIVKMPTRTDLRDEYIELRKNREPDDPDARFAHAFYLERQAEIEAGGALDNPRDFVDKPDEDGRPLEVSAFQHYFNLIADFGWDSFNCEYQNDPPADENIQALVLTAYHIQTNCLSGLERGHVPPGTVAITIGADVKKLGLHWVAIAWDERGVGCIIYYDFFEFQTEGRKAADCEVLILEGLFDWHEALQKNPFTGHDGEPAYADLALIDAGWKEESWTAQPVQTFCSQVGYKSFVPSKGMSPYYAPKPARNIVLGDNWHWDAKQSLLFMNSDHWKLKVHEGFLTDRSGDTMPPGTISLCNPPSVDGRVNRTGNLSFVKHILAESWERRFVPGFKGWRTGWWKSPKPNHYFDGAYAGIVGRSMQGISVLSMPMLTSVKAGATASPPVPKIETPHANYSNRNRW